MIREINLHARINKNNSIHPLEKLMITLISLILCSYTVNIYIICINILLISVLVLRAEIPLVIVKKFLMIGLTFSLISIIPILFIGNNTSIVIIVLRTLNGAMTISLLSLTTPLDHIIALISKSEFLRDIGDIAKSMERFLILIEDDFNIIFKAVKSRGGFNGYKKSIRDFGYVCSLVIKNLFSSWKEIKDGLNTRCYNGRHNYSFEFSINTLRVISIIIYGIISLSLCIKI